MQDFTRRTLEHVSVCTPLDHTHRFTVVQTKNGRPQGNLDLRQARQLFGQLLQTVIVRRTYCAVEQAAPQRRVLVHQQHPRTRPPCRNRSRHSSGSCADHEHIDVVMLRFVAIRIGFMRCLAKPRRTSNPALIEHPCAAGRTHEGLVIEPRSDESRKQPEDATEIPVDIGPSVLALAHQPI